MKRGVRLLQIIELLKERAYTTAELAAVCGVSVRTIQNDLLELQGEPLYLPLEVGLRREWRFVKPASDAKKTCA